MRPQKQDFNETPILKKIYKNVPGEKSVLQFSSKQSPCSQSSEETCISCTYYIHILYTHTIYTYGYIFSKDPSIIPDTFLSNIIVRKNSKFQIQIQQF